ncbi:hypothetical protein [Streptomyces sp. RP5T]|uniref:hypothetical protein n=1 Tax=Streptomyces sp. RP5T TaxID=2490848 RepID=UPI0021AE0A8F|nr:hypothetical protein [Streptomyces sp. RP5T]
MTQVPRRCGSPYGIVGFLGGLYGPVGDQEGEVEPADPAAVRAQQPIQICGHAQYLAPLRGIVAVSVAAYGVVHVGDQVRQEAGGLGEAVL